MAPKITIRNHSYLQSVQIVGGKGSLDGYKLSEALTDVATASANLASQMASSPDGTDITPPKIGNLQAVHLGNGILNFAITDGGQIQRAIDYVVELANNPGFSGSETIHFSPSRNGRTIVPNGTWYVKAYSQYRLGGPPSAGVTQGPILVSGSVNASLLPSQGCGTGQPGQTGAGAGTSVSR